MRATLTAIAAALALTAAAPAWAVVDPTPSSPITTVLTFSEVRTTTFSEVLFRFNVDEVSIVDLSVFNSGSLGKGLIRGFFGELRSASGQSWLLETEIWHPLPDPGFTLKSISFSGLLAPMKYEIWGEGDPSPAAGIAGVVNITTVPAPVPEPKSWPLLAAGLGALTFLMRRKPA